MDELTKKTKDYLEDLNRFERAYKKGLIDADELERLKVEAGDALRGDVEKEGN